MKALDVASNISVAIIIILLIGLLSKHSPTLLTVIAFFFGRWTAKNL